MQKVAKGDKTLYLIEDPKTDASGLEAHVGRLHPSATVEERGGVVVVSVPDKSFYAELGSGEGLVIGFFGELRALKTAELSEFYL